MNVNFYKYKKYPAEEVFQKSLSLHHYPFFSQEKFWFIEKRGEIRLCDPLATIPPAGGKRC
jgi:hypothetical protein